MRITPSLKVSSRSGPPTRQVAAIDQAKEPASQPAQLAEEAKPLPDSGFGSGAKAALAGLAVFSSLAAPAAAAQAMPPAEMITEEIVELSVEPIKLDLSVPQESLKEVRSTPADSTKTKIGFQFNSVNDFMPDSWTSWLGGPEHKVPDGSAFDDDGWTAEVQMIAHARRGNSETVVGARLGTVTQPGSRVPHPADYQGFRTDLAEIVVQKNERVELSDKLTLDYGAGGGLQAIGNVGGEAMQRWWHREGPVGGRVGDDLQGLQMNDGRRVMPILTGGAKMTYELNPNLDFVGSGQTTVPLGRGLAFAGVRAGLRTQVGPLDAEFGAKLDAAWTDAPEFQFHDPTGVREGLYGRLEYKTGDWGGIYTQLETGGIRNEPILTMGFRIGLGGKPRLNPFW